MASLAIPTIVTKALPSLNSTVLCPFEFAYKPSNLADPPQADANKLADNRSTAIHVLNQDAWTTIVILPSLLITSHRAPIIIRDMPARLGDGCEVHLEVGETVVRSGDGDGDPKAEFSSVATLVSS